MTTPQKPAPIQLKPSKLRDEITEGRLLIDAMKSTQPQDHNPMTTAVLVNGKKEVLHAIHSMGADKVEIVQTINEDGSPYHPDQTDFKPLLGKDVTIDIEERTSTVEAGTAPFDAVRFIGTVDSIEDSSQGLVRDRYVRILLVGLLEPLDFEPPEVKLDPSAFGKLKEAK
jgi:hypothetical protein